MDQTVRPLHVLCTSEFYSGRGRCHHGWCKWKQVRLAALGVNRAMNLHLLQPLIHARSEFSNTDSVSLPHLYPSAIAQVKSRCHIQGHPPRTNSRWHLTIFRKINVIKSQFISVTIGPPLSSWCENWTVMICKSSKERWKTEKQEFLNGWQISRLPLRKFGALGQWAEAINIIR